MSQAIFVEKSGNKKIAGKGKVSATYASTLASCPSACKLRRDGCYAESGRVGMVVHRLNKSAAGLRPEAVARQEAQVIRRAFSGQAVPQDGSRGGRDLRLHVSGDARTNRAANILGEAAKDWKSRGGGAVWTYTHAWKTVRRASWGKDVSVLASMEDPSLAQKAIETGYAPTLVVPSHPEKGKSFRVEGSDVVWISCVEQTRGVACSECRLCMKADSLRARNMGIAFAAHGPTNKIKKHLKVAV